MRKRAFQKIQVLRILKWVGLSLIFAAVVAHILVKLWFGPAYVEMQVKRSLLNWWSGPVGVGDIEFNYNGIMFLRNVRFYDKGGREVMKAEGVTLVLCKWPSLNAPPRIIDVERFDVRLNFEDGKPVLPLRLDQNKSGPQYLEYLRVKRASVSIGDAKSTVIADGLYEEFVKVPNGYEFNISSGGENDEYRVRVKGAVDLKNEGVQIRLKWIERASREQTSALLKAFEVPVKLECEGKVEADLRVRGNLSDIESLWPEGIVEFNDWTILENQKVAGQKIGGVLAVEKRHLGFRKFSGQLFNGNFNSLFYADIGKSGTVAYGGDVLATGVDLTEFTRFWETEKRFTRGTGLLNLKFTGDTNSIESIRGNGAVFIDDADLWRIPVIGELFKSIGVWEYRLGGMSDAEAVFRLSAARMKLERGRLSNSFSAIEAEPGGEIDLKTGQIDMFVVAMPLKDIDKIINKLPVMSWFAKLKDKLIRLRLKGHWSEPAGKLISKQPIKDVKEGTMEFFKAVTDSGGQITDTIKSEFKTIINKTDNRDN